MHIIECLSSANGEIRYPDFSEINDITSKCNKCHGIGAIPFMECVFVPYSNICQTCNGTGIKTLNCSACGGTGKKGKDICGICRGSGKYIFKKSRFRKDAIKCPECNVV